jgi:hypothetical protein
VGNIVAARKLAALDPAKKSGIGSVTALSHSQGTINGFNATRSPSP